MSVAVKPLAVRGGIQFVVEADAARPTVLLVCNRTRTFVETEAALREAGHDVVVTDSAELATELATRLRPHVVVIDPQLDCGETAAGGAESLCAALKMSVGNPAIPLLLAAADDCPRPAVVACLRAGADDFLDLSFSECLLVKKVVSLAGRERAARELEQCDLSNMALLQALPDMMLRVRRDGTVAAVVPSPNCPIDYTPEEMLGRHVSELIEDEPARMFLRHLDEAFASDPPQAVVFEYKVSVGGAPRWREARLVVLNHNEVLAIVRDTTARIEATEQAHQLMLERRLLRLIENANDVITVVEAGGVVRYQSPAIERVLGHNAEAMTGRPLSFYLLRYVHRADRRRVIGAIRTAGAMAGVTAPIEFRVRGRDGRWHVLESVGNNLVADPDVRGVVINSRDVTERKELMQRLMQADKLSSIGLVLAALAHEINNPLTPIVAYSDMLLRDGAVTGEAADMVRTIHEESSRAGKIVRNLLQFARQRPPARSLTDINELLQRTLDLRSYSLKVSNVEIVTDFAALPVVNVDEGQLQQVFANMIINAEHALLSTGRPGRLTLRTRLAEQDDSRRVIITISDTGPGIAPDHLNKIFDPFFTTKPVGEGTGLGLALSYGIINDHGGEIQVESVVGRGTAFSILLPINADNCAQI